MYSSSNVVFLLNILVLIFLVKAVISVKGHCPARCVCSTIEGSCVELSLTKFPEERFPGSLMKLDISRNLISELGEYTIRYWMIVSLRKLNLSNNAINRINEQSLMGQSGLKELDLSGNEITTIPPKTFVYPPHLQWLSLANNGELEMPEDAPLLESSSLKVLHLEHCNIDRISVINLQKVMELEELYISHNRIEVIATENEGETSALKNLKVLDVSHNQLQELPPEILALLSLETLVLRKNKLKVLGEMKYSGEFCEKDLYAETHIKTVSS
ncbi:podocan-like protein 1 [Zootermopsis nevadensis]|uniref:Leucine-rich repeat-containing G-protein coupled receptor 6 n=1 Tax=Zootermopsis nevadensis TaxID=136037 RepID=A0A067R7S4_ZOONE|nr:podocan-like protein 1 [Zootermopsis nevadensis]KDR19454.1 Leucine-rich repeat-containing G-protein coupled receptor 6 [Zootermopsis nevadensis]